jgi:hypothetical protein
MSSTARIGPKDLHRPRTATIESMSQLPEKTYFPGRICRPARGAFIEPCRIFKGDLAPGCPSPGRDGGGGRACYIGGDGETLRGAKHP